MADSLQFTEPLSYYLISGVAFAGFVALAVMPFRSASRKTAFEIGFLLSMWIALFACRWPVFLLPHQMNPDESGFIAAAIKARVDCVPWRGFDTSTSGPFNSYILLLPTLFGAEIGYFSARIIGLCLIAGATTALYFTVKWIHGAGIARLSVVGPVTLLAMTKHTELVHYSSEHLSIFLTTAALAAAAYLVRGTGSQSSRIVACATAGLCLGSTGFAKREALPIALVILVGLVTAICMERPSSSVRRRVEILATSIATFTVPVVMIIALFASGVLGDAIISYFKMAFVYIGSQPPVEFPIFLATVRKHAGEYPVFLVCSLLLMLVGTVVAVFSRPQFTRVVIWALPCSLVLCVVSFFVVYQPHRPYPHYLLFTVIPISFCAANALEVMRRRYLRLERRGLARGLVVSLFLVPIGLTSMTAARKMNPEVIAFLARKTEAVAHYVRPGDRMLVWGWNAEYYVRTQTTVSAPDLNIATLVEPGPYREYFRERFMSEVRAPPPRVIVDDVAPHSFMYDNHATQGIESFPMLDSFVKTTYIQREEVAGVRIFVA